MANAYDPYLSVCLPIIKEEKLELYFVPAQSHREILEPIAAASEQPQQVGENNIEDTIEEEKKEPEEQKTRYELNALSAVDITVSKSMRVAELKTAIISQLDLRDIPAQELVVCNQRYGKIS